MQLEVGLANLGRSLRLQMWRAGGGESYGGHLMLTLSTSTLGSEEGVRAPEPQPRGIAMALPMSTAHIHPGCRLSMAWTLQLSTSYSSQPGCTCRH